MNKRMSTCEPGSGLLPSDPDGGSSNKSGHSQTPAVGTNGGRDNNNANGSDSLGGLPGTQRVEGGERNNAQRFNNSRLQPTENNIPDQPLVGRQMTVPSIVRETRRYNGMKHLSRFKLGNLRSVSLIGGSATGAYDVEDENGAHVRISRMRPIDNVSFHSLW